MYWLISKKNKINFCCIWHFKTSIQCLYSFRIFSWMVLRAGTVLCWCGSSVCRHVDISLKTWFFSSLWEVTLELFHWGGSECGFVQAFPPGSLFWRCEPGNRNHFGGLLVRPFAFQRLGAVEPSDANSRLRVEPTDCRDWKLTPSQPTARFTLIPKFVSSLCHSKEVIFRILKLHS